MPPIKSSKKPLALPGLPTSRSMAAVGLSDYITMYFGQPGVGKTTFVNDLFPRVLFGSTDRGTRFLSAMRVECNRWEDWLNLLKQLENGGAKNYDALAIDHVADWADQAEVYVLKKLGVETLADAKWGKGWSTLKKELTRFMFRVKRLGLGIVFIAHERVVKVTIRGIEVDKTQPLMSKQAWDIIVPLADLVGYCGIKPIKVEGHRKLVRVLETEPRDDLYVKDRTRRKRPEGRDWEPLDGRKFIGTFGA